MPSSTAVVFTDAAARYAKQLVAHLGRKVAVEDVDGTARRLVFGYGTGVVRPEPDRLVLDAWAGDEESLAQVQDVLTRHLERFGARRALAVDWQRVDQ
jgi:hypothetical protein